MATVKRDRSKPIFEKDFKKIKVGDAIFDECYGPCSGGAGYDLGELVNKVTASDIHTASQSFSRITGKASSPPWAYFISFWQKGK